MDAKQLNARIEKWREMLKNDIFSDTELLKTRLRKGVPPCMRILVWPRLIQMQKLKLEERWVYHNLIQQNSAIEYEINLDIPRTFTE